MQKKSIIITLASLLLLSATLTAQNYKVVESSAKKTPTWVNSSQSEYIIVSAIGPDLEALKQECMRQVRMQILQSVAENVSFSSNATIEQEMDQNEITKFVDSYSSTYETQAANLPYLRGISASKIEDSYWEKRQDKKTKEVSYLYTIKYPLSTMELKKLIYEFEKRDKEMYDRYLALEADYSNVTSVEQIGRAIKDIEPLEEYFFDDVRKNAARNLKSKYRALYDNVSFKTVYNNLGEHVFALTLDGREITTSQRPVLSSDEAGQLQINQEGTRYKVTYDYAGSEYGKDNSISVRFLINGKPVVHKFYYNVSKQTVDINPEKTAYLTAKFNENGVITSLTARINMASKYKEFTVHSMTLNAPGLSAPLMFDNIDTTLSGRSTTLESTYEGEIMVLKPLRNKLNTLKGSMDVSAPELGDDIQRIYFNLTFQPNW